MSVDQHPAPTDRRADTHDDSSEPTAPVDGVELEFESAASTEAELQARVTALERALEASRSREREIVAQYERVLENRDAESTENTEHEASDGLLSRLLERWR